MNFYKEPKSRISVKKFQTNRLNSERSKIFQKDSNASRLNQVFSLNFAFSQVFFFSPKIFTFCPSFYLQNLYRNLNYLYLLLIHQSKATTHQLLSSRRSKKKKQCAALTPYFRRNSFLYWDLPVISYGNNTNPLRCLTPVILKPFFGARLAITFSHKSKEITSKIYNHR